MGKKKNKNKELIFYFDYVCPYSFLAWRKINRIWQDYDLILKAEPVLLFEILSKYNTKHFSEIEEKKEYFYRDILRSAGKETVGLVFPPNYPFNSLIALKATYLMKGKPEYYTFITHLFTLCWQEGTDISNIELIKKVMKIYSLDIEAINNNEILENIKLNTDIAIKENKVFGLPFVIFEKEKFWGNDRIDILEEYLKGEDFVDKKELKRASEIQPQANYNVYSS
ncbi:MAG: 2-hydroxychromene-2-carboxylate isomerase [Candidatus Sericytochromatia bacterium]|nr:MAG: 2-hydroxychromene-2-carboxylate isomerase [Candidatus Sericytochromatia bacterium]